MIQDWFVRTLVPIIVGTVLGWLIILGFNVDPGALTVVTTGLVIGAYNNAARLVEGLWPTAGRIMMSFGLSKNVPVYVRSNDPFAVAPPVGGGPAQPGLDQ